MSIIHRQPASGLDDNECQHLWERIGDRGKGEVKCAKCGAPDDYADA